MIRINLLPSKDAAQAIGRRQRNSAMMLGVAIALMAMIVPYIVQGRRLATLDREIEQVQTEIRRYEEQVKQVKELDRLKKDLEAKLQVIRALNDKRVGPSRVLVDLAQAAPENLWLIDVTETGGKATMTGMALDNETIARFMRQLQSSGYFHAVDLVETSRNVVDIPSAGGEKASLTRFIVSAGIDYFGRGGKPPEPLPGEAAKQGPAG